MILCFDDIYIYFDFWHFKDYSHFKLITTFFTFTIMTTITIIITTIILLWSRLPALMVLWPSPPALRASLCSPTLCSNINIISSFIINHISYHIISCHFMSCHVMSSHVMSGHVMFKCTLELPRLSSNIWYHRLHHTENQHVCTYPPTYIFWRKPNIFRSPLSGATTVSILCPPTLGYSWASTFKRYLHLGSSCGWPWQWLETIQILLP